MSPKKIAILQSNYIPWKGYFDIINMVDEFVIYDEAQYTKNDWRNRNLIKTSQGPLWLTIPILTKGKLEQRILDSRVSDEVWRKKHWKSIVGSYGKARHFSRYASVFEALYLSSEEALLSRINHSFLTAICGILGIETQITWSQDYPRREGRTEALIDICRAAGAGTYLSGPAARDYIDEAQFKAAGIDLAYMDYAGYPAYTQLHGAFEHRVSILDLLFNEGPDAPRYMKSFRP